MDVYARLAFRQRSEAGRRPRHARGFFRAYEKASDTAVDPEAARFWEVFGNLRWGIITISQARTHIDGFVKSVELASIGRRTSETELELLNLIEQ